MQIILKQFNIVGKAHLSIVWIKHKRELLRGYHVPIRIKRVVIETETTGVCDVALRLWRDVTLRPLRCTWPIGLFFFFKKLW